MSAADITLVVFTLCNSFRVLAYVPQIARAARDGNGAQAISFATWSLFLIANASAVAYALVNKQDWTMAAIFIGNAAGCVGILLIAAWKRSRHRSRLVDHAAQPSKTAGIPRQRGGMVPASGNLSGSDTDGVGDCRMRVA